MVEEQLAPFTGTMPKPVLVGAGQQPAPRLQWRRRAIDIARRGMVAHPSGISGANDATPATPAKTYQPSRRDSGPGLDR